MVQILGTCRRLLRTEIQAHVAADHEASQSRCGRGSRGMGEAASPQSLPQGHQTRGLIITQGKLSSQPLFCASSRAPFRSVYSYMK